MSNEDFAYIYNRVPRLCVDVVVETDEGIILSRRDLPPAAGQWHIPGGTVLWGETLREAVKRVAAEELGLDVAVHEIIGVTEYSPESGFGQSVGVAFRTTVTSGKMRGCEQAREVGVFRTIPRDTIAEQVEFLQRHFKMVNQVI